MQFWGRLLSCFQLFQHQKNDPRPKHRRTTEAAVADLHLLGWLLFIGNLARQVELEDTEVRTEFVRRTFHPSAASTTTSLGNPWFLQFLSRDGFYYSLACKEGQILV